MKAKSVVNKLLETDPDDPASFLKRYVDPFGKLAKALKRFGFYRKEDDEERLVWERGRYEVEIVKSDYDQYTVSWDANETSGYTVCAYVYASTYSDSGDYLIHDQKFVKTPEEAALVAKQFKKELCGS